jgi:hypothetical protein
VKAAYGFSWDTIAEQTEAIYREIVPADAAGEEMGKAKPAAAETQAASATAPKKAETPVKKADEFKVAMPEPKATVPVEGVKEDTAETKVATNRG